MRAQAADIGIGAIGVALPKTRIPTADIAVRLGVDADRLARRLGFRALARKDDLEQASDLALAAVRDLSDQGIDLSTIECLCVITQNPDGTGIPPLSSILHGKLGLAHHVAAFDIAQGCAGYVHGLALTQALMSAQGFRRGLLITADPYSTIVDPDDHQTALIFGDAATATLLSEAGTWRIGHTDFGTAGAQRDALTREPAAYLRMNGKRIARFCATVVPESIQRALKLNGVALSDMDEVLLHQASRYIVELIGAALGMAEKTPFYAGDYGNTVSSSLPLALALHVSTSVRRLVLCGFGVGLSWASTVLTRESLAPA